MPSRLSADRLLPRAALALALLALIAAPGCVRRRLLVRSNPPGAMVYVDNQPIGTTPCATSFTYYGTREIKLVKPGYETLRVEQPIPPPWYQIPPIDFVAENAVPADINDYRTVTYTMSPQIIKPTDHLMAEAEQLRTATQQGGPAFRARAARTAHDHVARSGPAAVWSDARAADLVARSGLTGTDRAAHARRRRPPSGWTRSRTAARPAVTRTHAV
jgi:hypothetical protein